MRIVVPFTELQQATRDALDATGLDYETVDVSGADDAYWDLLSALWGEGETFSIVEHDVVVRPGVLDSLDDCQEQWCGYAHSYLGGAYYGLGCVKFDARLLRSQYDLMDVVALMHDKDHPPKHWCRLDAWIREVLGFRHVWFHHHEPALAHGHDRPSHGCQ